ncbi:ARPC5 / Arp2/3 complex subunit 5 [Leishmania donovani]|uniref:ARP2/3_complex_16kDa_subunit_-_putative n=3 Tax=Leishmania donovani species complex TaxID=38574 RepID=A0A6L0WHR1_LEIIN|nr:putative ARP2/3 complex 16kDa subunit [Leishmania infantum JPCM5]XP_003858216.1 ARP2/3 complex 16kDa subunit, putative [Leishmania donovani]CAC9443036.1 ARP2/3_complex_16kDa_subunit_-_putative [Leishmania infantum]AYU75934.1 ARP2/3 complex 16kDa subunit, putative [Leishmania donovani]TPP44040.1 ARP2/3 complex 16 kDa subunit (p16-Arc) family protein [Leishmania donovani]TPP51871.1 ARP2/3 complex 16 kDa subunit (p16-Arc) family protein [Leishmania donovani]CAJ1986000.1 ARPC5 / Arp2/3 complex|eukprot:XP_001462989.1 putative ARP2/3 complex 16kDa subunit [Leishmania infantum JPCM5]
MASAGAPAAPTSRLCAELDALETTSLQRLPIDDARRVLSRLDDVDAQLCRSAGVAVLISDSSEGAVPCTAERGTSPSAHDSSMGTLKQLRSTFAAQLTISQQDALMRVLYACMASCASGVTAPTSEASCWAPIGAHNAHAPLSPAGVRRLYEWHAALHDAAGDGAVVRALMSR